MKNNFFSNVYSSKNLAILQTSHFHLHNVIHVFNYIIYNMYNIEYICDCKDDFVRGS